MDISITCPHCSNSGAVPSEAIGMSVQCGQCSQYFVPTAEVFRPQPPSSKGSGLIRKQRASNQKTIRPVRHAVNGVRARSSSGNTQGIWIVLVAIAGLIGVGILMSGGRSPKQSQAREAEVAEPVLRNESSATTADPMDFTDLKKELYGDNTLGSGTVGEKDAECARWAIREIAVGSDFDHVMSALIGPGHYSTQEQAIKHLRPYLERAQAQGALPNGVLDKIDANQAANLKLQQDYRGRHN